MLTSDGSRSTSHGRSTSDFYFILALEEVWLSANGSQFIRFGWIFNLWAFTELHFPRRKKLSLEVNNYHHIIKQLDLIDANDLLTSWPAFDEQMQILQKHRVNVEVSV